MRWLQVGIDALAAEARLAGATLRDWRMLATIGLFTAIAYFSSWFGVLLYIDNENLWTIQYMLKRVMNEIQLLRSNADLAGSEEGALLLASLPNESAKMALTVITMTPVLAFYPFFQKYFVKGLTLGSVKG